MTDAVWGIDTIDAGVPEIPRCAPVVWWYKTGTTTRPEIEWEPEDLAAFPHSHLISIDQGFGNQADESRWLTADEYDLEAQAWTPKTLVPVVRARNARRISTRVYASLSPFDQLVIELRSAQVPMHSLFWREANWNLNEAEARGQLGGIRYALQWASPTSNPDTEMPCTHLSLAVAGADLNVMQLRDTSWQGQ